MSNENVDNAQNSPQEKRKGILMNKNRQSKKSNRSVNFSLDYSDKPFPTCVYYGVKSYVHQFYEPRMDTSPSDTSKADDFEFIIEPGARRKKKCWFRFGITMGILSLMVGLSLILFGILTPPKEEIIKKSVGKDNVEILDPWAMTFNRKLQFIQITGLVVFCAGGFFLIFTLTMSMCIKDTRSKQQNSNWVRYLEDPHQYTLISERIPLSEEIVGVQNRSLM